MTSRKLGLGLVVLVASAFSFAGTASAHGTGSAEVGEPGTCVVHSLPSFIAQGEGATAATVADVIEVECKPDVYGTKSKIKLTAGQVFSRCQKHVKWYLPNQPAEFTENGLLPEGFRKSEGIGVSLQLDADGNGTAVLLAGPNCMVGDSLITASMEEEPFESFTAAFHILPPIPTEQGVFALPSSQVEDSFSSAVATIIQVEFTNGSEEPVRIASEELFHRCRLAPHLRWILSNGTEVEFEDEGEPLGEEPDDAFEGAPEVTKVPLDNDGNAFVIAIGDSSCAPGTSLIEADLEAKPFTTPPPAEFTIEAPRPTI